MSFSFWKQRINAVASYGILSNTEDYPQLYVRLQQVVKYIKVYEIIKITRMAENSFELKILRQFSKDFFFFRILLPASLSKLIWFLILSIKLKEYEEIDGKHIRIT